MKDAKIPISEIFSSIQGEGMFAGVPSLFIRTSGCPLRCWWCDTPYTSWKPEMKQQTLEEIASVIALTPARHVVITGGEPMLHPKEVGWLTDFAHSLNKPVTIETNGTIHETCVKPTLWSVSPKLKSSTPDATQFPNEAALHKRKMKEADLDLFQKSAPNCQIKFVVTHADDLLEIEQMVAMHHVKHSNVWLMPEGRTAQEVVERSKNVMELAIQHGFNFSSRLHTIAWGQKRGV